MEDNRWITSIQHAQKRGFALKRITLQCIRNGDVDGMRALFAPQENLSTISGALSDDLDRAVIACLFTWAQAAFAAETGDADTSALERDFGFKPNTSLRQGLRAFAEWYAEFYR